MSYPFAKINRQYIAYSNNRTTNYNIDYSPLRRRLNILFGN